MHHLPVGSNGHHAYHPHPDNNDPALALLSYGTLPAGVQFQLPLRPAGLTAVGYYYTNNNHHLNYHRPTNPTMTYVQSEDDLAELQQLSNQYEAEATVNLFVAIAFTYFEALIRIGDVSKVLEEETRLRSLENVLDVAGYKKEVYEDFEDETFELLQRTAESLQTSDPGTTLLHSFNDESIQNSIITHLKVLTAAWMKTHQDDYQPFLDQTVDDYCAISLEPYVCEIDHIGISALSDVLIKPAGIALEILYLDRSPGAEVNTHRFDPLTEDGIPLSTMRLLYRPGHYDILYRAEDMAPSFATPEAIPTYLQYNQYNQPCGPELDCTGGPDFMTLIPGMSFATDPLANAQLNWMPGPMSAPSFGFADFAPAPTPATYVSANLGFATLPVPPVTHNCTVMPMSQSTLHAQGDREPFRFSAYELDPLYVAGSGRNLSFQTSIFRK
ncbi:hypothetical protein LTR04_005109 [Oleoguttula sp. CCFEE 6159]|nr:hypothetical protein LTR04_005109 [Oleoguttula sp. CCFEE 6159]